MSLQEVTLQFFVDEEVTPKVFANKIAFCCANYGAIREGERVGCEEFLYEFTGYEKVDLFHNDNSITVAKVELIHP